MRRRNIRRVAAVASSLVREVGLESVLKEAGIELSFEGSPSEVAQAGAGISEVDLAVAESGTLAQDVTELRRRLVSTLPPVHIALVRASNIVETFSEALERAGRGEGGIPGYLAFITGPSRTGDIESVLTIGVHGPGELLIVFVGDGGPDGGRPR